MSRFRLEESITYAIYQTSRLVRVTFLKLAKEAGFDLTPEQWFVLNKLNWRDGQSQTELGDSILSDRPNMTRILSAMERKGLVKRKNDPGDGRKQLVHITKKGQKMEEGFAKLVMRERTRMGRRVPSKDREKMLKMLKEIEEHMASI